MNITYPFDNKGIIRFMRIIFFYALLLLTFQATGQSYYFDTYGVQEGLSSSKVYSIIQDRYDYIWLGTESGVSRFNGVEFDNYSSENGLAENGVMSLFEDSRGYIWLGHLDGGISRFDGREFQIFDLDTLEIKGDITSITEYETDNIWITTSGSGALLIKNAYSDNGAREFIHFTGKEGLGDIVFGSAISRDSGFFCLTDIGIKIYDENENKFRSFLLEGLTKYFIKTTMYEDRQGNWWFGTYNGGLYRYERKTGEMKIYDKRDGLAKNWVSYVTEDRQGNIWVGTFGGGITVINQQGGLKTYNTENGLPDDFIKWIIEDKEGNILIGSQDRGLSIFKGEYFVTYSTADGLGEKSVWAIYQDSEGKYWFGTNEGLSVYDPSGPKGQNFLYHNQENRSIGNKIRFIKEDENNNIWIGTDGDGIFQYVSAKGKFVYDSYLNMNLYKPGEQHVKALEVDKNNNLWVGTFYGLGFWDIDIKEGRMYTQINGLAGNNIKSLYCDSKGMLWIGSDQKKGLTRFNPDDDSFTIIDLGHDLAPLSVTEDQDGKIWIGTSAGVYVYGEDSVLLHLTQADGLLSNNITLVDVDQLNNIYIGTNKGLNLYIQDENTIFTFTRKNGFVGIETKDQASYRDKEGNMWFGTANGVTRYNPVLFQRSNLEPLTHIKGIQVNYLDRGMIPNMKLNHTEKSIVFDYYSICLTNPDAVKYQVKLEGAEEEWRPVTTQTRAIYSALSPDRYTFMVKAQNDACIWNTEPISFSFVIKPPFYQTWWFITGCIVLAFAAILAYIKIREKNLIREKRILEEKVAERTAEVVQKSKELEEKNKDITDSIRYAKRIQNAILPPESSFAATFILFKPKDIVSGDFYWLAVTETKQIIAAVDCTGHGVPGAFMSIIGHNSLNKIVKEYGFVKPAEILDLLNDEVSNTLQKQSDEDEVKDGMDVALIVYDFTTRELEYAGAYNPLYLFRNGELTEIKGDRFAIGRSSIKTGQKFTNHKLQLESGDATYIFSDGYADQFGGEEGKKFKSRAVKKMLSDIQHLTMEEQKSYMDNAIEDWRGDLPQIDDILFIGSKVP